MMRNGGLISDTNHFFILFLKIQNRKYSMDYYYLFDVQKLTYFLVLIVRLLQFRLTHKLCDSKINFVSLGRDK